MRQFRSGVAASAAAVLFVLFVAPGINPAVVGIAVAADDEKTADSGFSNGSKGLGGTVTTVPPTTALASDPAAVSPQPDKAVDRTTLGKTALALTDGAANGEMSTVDGRTQNAAVKSDATEPVGATTLAATAAAVEPDSPAVNAPEKASVPEVSGNGSMTQTIEIDAPAYHGIAPKLSLQYDSARKSRLGGLYQGWLGFGWGMDGFDIIEKVSAGYGVPAWDSTDIYMLNGEPVVPCSSQTNCEAGSTHTTERESFLRIVAANHEWTVTDKMGVVKAFKSVADIAGVTLSMTDIANHPKKFWTLSYHLCHRSERQSNTILLYLPGSADVLPGKDRLRQPCSDCLCL